MKVNEYHILKMFGKVKKMLVTRLEKGEGRRHRSSHPQDVVKHGYDYRE